MTDWEYITKNFVYLETWAGGPVKICLTDDRMFLSECVSFMLVMDISERKSQATSYELTSENIPQYGLGLFIIGY